MRYDDHRRRDMLAPLIERAIRNRRNFLSATSIPTGSKHPAAAVVPHGASTLEQSGGVGEQPW